jgi:uncharacterized RDD family membrane protein YckC
VYCQKCGAPNDDQASVCGKCGTALQNDGLAGNEAAPPSPTVVRYAGFWRRVGASLIDIFILQTLSGIAVIFLIAIQFTVGVFATRSETLDDVYQVVFMVLFITVGVAASALYLLYWPLMESSSRQATLGKRALDIVVTDIDGKRIPFARAVGRNLGKIVSAIIYYVGFIMIAFTKKKQGLHDMMAGCVVVMKK